MKRIIIGIDPDIDKSGLAVWHTNPQELELMQFALFPLMNKLIDYSAKYDLTVRLEAGHTLKQYWHKQSVKIAKNVGANNAVGQIIEQFMIQQKINYELVKPKGFSSWSHEKFCLLTGWPIKKRTNSEKRVAGLLCFGRK